MSGDAPKAQDAAAVKDNQLPAAGACKRVLLQAQRFMPDKVSN